MYTYLYVHVYTRKQALDVLLNTKCIDPIFNRFYEADFSLKVL